MELERSDLKRFEPTIVHYYTLSMKLRVLLVCFPFFGKSLSVAKMGGY